MDNEKYQKQLKTQLKRIDDLDDEIIKLEERG